MSRSRKERAAPDLTGHYLADFAKFEQRLNGESGSAVHQIRRGAIDAFARLGFPTSRNEAWRHTNLAPVTREAFGPAAAPDGGQLARTDLDPFTISGLAGSRLVFLNGFYAPELSDPITDTDGAVVGNLAAALRDIPDLVEPHLGGRAAGDEGGFAALNTAFIQDGAFVYLPDGTDLADPIHLLFLAVPGSDATVSYPRNLIVAGAGSRATVIESYASTQARSYLTNAVTEMVAMEGAALDHYKIQEESDGAFHVATVHSVAQRGSTLTSHNITLGGRLTRNDTTAVLDGENARSTLNGLYLLDGEEHVDNHTLIEHARPDCTSHEFYKGVLDDRATAVFRGKIHVHREAQKTDAYQSNQNLLLSDDAEVTSKPQLEIYADDVKCSHGSTTGQLNEEAVFYLRARGIGPEEAARVLTRAFAGEVLDGIELAPVRDRLDSLVSEKLG